MTDSANNDKPLDQLTVKELREIAKEIPDVTGISSMKKDDLISLVQKHQGGAPEEAPQEAVEEKVAEEKTPVEAEAKKEEKAPAAKKAAPAKAKKAGPKKPKKLETVKDFKEAIAQLKAEKVEIKQTGSRKEISILRRRINRLRKRTRKIKEASA